MLEEILKNELEVKYKIDFNEVKIISELIRDNTYDQNKKSVYILIDKLKDETITSKCIERYKFIEKREFSYVSDLNLYKKIEKGYHLFYLLFDFMNLDILWNKEINKIYDADYKFLKRMVDIFLIETDELIKDIEEYELGGIRNETEEDTNAYVRSYKRKS